MHRIFIAINLPEYIKNKLAGYKEKFPELPAKWGRKENLHISLVFIGDVSDQELGEVCKIAKEVVEKNNVFSVGINRVCFGPENKIPPRFIWAEGEKSPELFQLKNDLENALINSGKVSFSSDNKGFRPHITLCRINQWEFKKIEPEEVPQIDEGVDFNFTAESVEIMESILGRGSPNYEILLSIPLKSD